MHIIESRRVSTVKVAVMGLLAFVLAATGVKAVNVTAEAAYLVVGWDDVTDSTSPGETVSLGGGLSWSGLTTTEITVHWYLDGSYKGGVTLTDVDEDNPGFYMLEGYGPTWVATAGPHTLTMVVDPGNAISESNEADNQVQRAFTISVNSTPTDISLSASSINENVAANSTVGTLSTTDPDAGNTFTYTLVAGAGSTDNAAFNISGSSLRITASPNYEAKNSYSVRVRTTDQGGLWYEEAFTITINDVNEPAPTFEVPEMRANGTVVLQWSSITNHLYTVHHSTNLLNGFTVRQGSIPGTPPMNSYTDTVNGVQMKSWKITTEE